MTINGHDQIIPVGQKIVMKTLDFYPKKQGLPYSPSSITVHIKSSYGTAGVSRRYVTNLEEDIPALEYIATPYSTADYEIYTLSFWFNFD